MNKVKRSDEKIKQNFNSESKFGWDEKECKQCDTKGHFRLECSFVIVKKKTRISRGKFGVQSGNCE